MPNKIDLITSEEKKVTIRVWKSSLSGLGYHGHATLQTYGVNGIYASFWPINGRKIGKKISGVPGYHATSVEEDIRLENGKAPDYTIDLFSLDVERINNAYNAFLAGKSNWALPASSMLRGKNTFNCSGLVWHLLEQGKIKHLFKDSFWPIDGPFGSITGAGSTIPKAIPAAMGSICIRSIVTYFFPNPGFKSGFLTGSLVGAAIALGLVYPFNLIHLGTVNAVGAMVGAERDDEALEKAIDNRAKKDTLVCIALGGLITGTSVKCAQYGGIKGSVLAILAGLTIGFLISRGTFNYSLNPLENEYMDVKRVSPEMKSILIQASIVASTGAIDGSIPTSGLRKFGYATLLTATGFFASNTMLGIIGATAITPNDIARLAIKALNAELQKYNRIPNPQPTIYELPDACGVS